jgi:two-component system, cell cycle response regulator
MSPRRELFAMVAIIGLALWGWSGERVALALVPVLLAILVGAGLHGWWRAHRAERSEDATGRRDELSGLSTREQLDHDIAVFLRDRRPDEQLTLYVFDLVGFKKYNDAFGYAAGDALLRHLSARLAGEVGDRGALYRLRGAQFALATTAATTETPAIRARAADALSEVGEGFLIECASGTAVVPREARNLSEALKLADQEVQAERGVLRRRGFDEDTIAPVAHAGGLAPSPYEVAELALAVGHFMGLDPDELEVVQAAASWRDVGMMAIPDELVHAESGLTDDQWHFFKLHTLVGERLLRANFGLDGVADVVRSSHERWDGGGYPDGLAGQDIPLGARIVFVCSAFQDMTSPRAHRAPLTAGQALGELRRNAGTQFDPEVVAAFVSAFSEAVGAPAGLSAER